MRPVLALVLFAAACTTGTRTVRQPGTLAAEPQLAVMGEWSCVVGADHRVRCFRGHAPVAAPAVDDAIGVAIGASRRVCVLRAGGAVWCAAGKPPTWTELEPLADTGIRDAAQILDTGQEVCARGRSGRVVCATGPALRDEPALLGASRIGGASQLCAVLPPGRVRCRFGAIIDVPITDAVDVDATQQAACAVHASGRVSCWRVDHVVPVPVDGVTDATRVALGMYRGCALQRTGRVACWTHTPFALERTPCPSPARDSGLANIVSIAVGGGHRDAQLHALARDGTLTVTE
jgi:hypothetical protein